GSSRYRRRRAEPAKRPRERVLRLVVLAERACELLARPRLVLPGQDVLEYGADLELSARLGEPQRLLRGGKSFPGRADLLVLREQARAGLDDLAGDAVPGPFEVP